MKIIINDSDNFILFFNKLNDISLDNEDDYKNIFLKLKHFYNIDIYGFYNINVFIDNNYGYILKIKKEDDLDLYYKQIDMHISVEKINILYKVNDFFFINNLDKFNIYFYDDFFYLEIIDEISDKEYNYLLENSEIIYENINIFNNKIIK